MKKKVNWEKVFDRIQELDRLYMRYCNALRSKSKSASFWWNRYTDLRDSKRGMNGLK